MNRILAYYKLNIKILIQDKIPLLWSIVVPSIFLFLNKNLIHDPLELRFWWAYIIINSYLLGVGLTIMRMKETGTLKTLFSISRQPFLFFFGNLLTQITFCFLSISVFDLIAIILINLPIATLFLSSYIIIILSIPVAFLGMLLTLFHKVHVNSLTTILNMILLVFLLGMNVPGVLQKINPIFYFANLTVMKSSTELIEYVSVSILFILIGVVCIRKFSVIPVDKR